MPEIKRAATLGERIRAELARQRWSITAFSNMLRDRGLTGRGATRAMLYRYMNQEVEPPPEFINTAAELLGVRAAWLATGEGARTEAEARAPRGDGQRDPVAVMQDAIPELERLDFIVTGNLYAASARLAAALERLGVPDAQPPEALAASLWEYVIAPAQRLGERVGRQLRVDGRAFGDYAVAMLHALTLGIEVAVPPDFSPDQLEDLEPIERQEDDNAQA